jgi:2-polyprenyl-3-methyl-5-hydroxy-6-metoxy-1,4-benzoquinol methylase
VDKIEAALVQLRKRYPKATFTAMNLPPLHGLPDASFDCVVSFQVIEHIQNDELFLQEIHRVLKPGGLALLTTPNRKQSLSRNPWHVREYLAEELTKLAQKYFSAVEMKGITGNEQVMHYHEQNRKSVMHMMRWDIFNLQYRLPAWLLRIPYEILNRRNRNTLQQGNNDLVAGITHTDFTVTDNADAALDLFLIVRK